jgi:L-alanine-DL-glutamate epimerase-like enolase superfamily enzyme
MKITALEVYILRAPDTGRPHWVSHFIVPKANEILVRLITDDGIEGIGIATSYTPIEAAMNAFRTGIAEQIVGADPLAPERLYQHLFALTSQRLAHEKQWNREALVRISAAVDMPRGTSSAKPPVCPCTGCSAAIAAKCPVMSPARTTATARI